MCTQLFLDLLKKTLKTLKKIIITPIISIPAWILSAGPTIRFALLRCGYGDSELVRTNTEVHQLLSIRSRGLGLGKWEPLGGFECLRHLSESLFWCLVVVAAVGAGTKIYGMFAISLATGISLKLLADLISAIFDEDYYECMYDQIRCRFRYYVLRDYNVQNSLGDTELHKAFYLEDIVTVRSLLETGIRERINIDLRNNQGRTAFDLVDLLQNPELRDYRSFYLFNLDPYYSQVKQELLNTTKLPLPVTKLILEYTRPLTLSSQENSRTTVLFNEILENPDIVLEIKEPEELEELEMIGDNHYALLPR